MPKLIYDFVVRAYGFLIRFYSLFNKKAALWVNGRKAWQGKLRDQLKGKTGTRIWIHSASLGEFEQGRPIIEALRKAYPDMTLILTFFSPSGFEVRKDYDQVDAISYLPLDTRSNAEEFLDITAPAMAIFIKYEFWFNHLEVLKERKVNTILVSGRMHGRQGFFRPWGSFFRKGLETFDYFFLQNEGSAELLDGIGFRNHTVNGDTRFDRVMGIRHEAKEIAELKTFSSGSKVILLGSSWPYEEILLKQFIKDFNELGFKVIIAPHELDEKRMTEFENDCDLDGIRLSQWENRKGSERLLIIDSIGILAASYRYADVAIVGGGFGAGIHSVLEPAVWGIPVVFGPRYQMFPEAVGLVEAGGAFSVEDQAGLNECLRSLLEEDKKRSRAGECALAYCQRGLGASEVVMNYVKETIG